MQRGKKRTENTSERKKRIRQGDTCKLRRIARRREQDASDSVNLCETSAQRRRNKKRQARNRLRNYSGPALAQAQRRGAQQFIPKKGT